MDRSRTRTISGPVPERIIPCSLLHRAMGKQYGAAERRLKREGWLYMITEDAWICGWGPQAHEIRAAANYKARYAVATPIADLARDGFEWTK